MLRLVQQVFLLCLFLYVIGLADSASDKIAKKCTYVFNEFLDRDKSGTLDVNDMIVAVDLVADNYRHWPVGGEKRNEAHQIVQKIMSGILEDAGTKDVGYVTLDQWLNVCGHHEHVSSPKNDWRSVFMITTFRLIDKNGNLVISSDEYKNFFLSFGKDAKDVKNAFKNLADEYNVITQKQFFTYWIQFFTSSDAHLIGNSLPGTTKFYEN